MELEVGMYVRTDDGEIGKITHIETEKFSEPAYTLDIFSQGIYKGCKWFDGKASYNIIDLIEVGDYVNGYPVYETIEYTDNTRAIVIADDNKSIIWEESSQHIKSIVTKEMFSSMSYKVGE